MKLQITLTHTGKFYKAELNSERISEIELYDLALMDYTNYLLEEVIKELRKFYDVELNEIDVS
jgi:hypothetical protein